MDLGPLQLVTPFDESNIPLLWSWLQPFKQTVLGDESPQSISEFVDAWRERISAAQTWGVKRNDEFGGYIEFKQIGYGIPSVGVCEALFKQSFWGKQNTLPILDQVMKELFAYDVDMVLFRPFQHNKAIRSLVKELGAREIGDVPSGETTNGIPVPRTLFGLVAEQWTERIQSRNSDMRVAS